jgi:hypothetical protein
VAWKARNKTELMIEVWEKLDCETVGAVEIESIETVVADVYGKAAVESPMRIARLLADEGAELRHSELMELYVRRASVRPHAAAFENLFDTSGLEAALASIRRMENLRRKFESESDTDGLHMLRKRAIAEKDRVRELARRAKDPAAWAVSAEIAEWFTLWLQAPELFDNWFTLRRRSADFVSKFGEISGK